MFRKYHVNLLVPEVQLAVFIVCIEPELCDFRFSLHFVDIQ